jgi:hypothetical protein
MIAIFFRYTSILQAGIGLGNKTINVGLHLVESGLL